MIHIKKGKEQEQLLLSGEQVQCMLLNYLVCRAILAWVIYPPECCSVKCLCYAANLKESKLDNCHNHQCDFYILGLASVVSAEPVTVGPYCILFFSGSRIILLHFQFCSHIKCAGVPCTVSFSSKTTCVALYYHGGEGGDEELQHL